MHITSIKGHRDNGHSTDQLTPFALRRNRASAPDSSLARAVKKGRRNGATGPRRLKPPTPPRVGGKWVESGRRG